MKENNNTRLVGMLGFAMRAGKIMIGCDLVCSEIRRRGGKVRLALVSSSASDATKKKINSKCEFYGTEIREIAIDSDELGRMLGKTFSPAVVAVCDDGFAREIKRAIDNTAGEASCLAINRKETSD